PLLSAALQAQPSVQQGVILEKSLAICCGELDPRAVTRQVPTVLRIPASCAREETPESRGMPCLFLNTERGFGGKPPQKSGFRRHLAGSKMPKEGSKMPNPAKPEPNRVR